MLALLLGSWSAQAVELLGFTPANPQAHQPIYVRVSLLGSERPERANVFQSGDRIDLALLFNDTVDPFNPPPPLSDRIETYAIGSLPAGNYRFRLYGSAPSSFLIGSLPLGVALPAAVPALGSRSVVFLALVIGALGCAFFGTSRSGAAT